MSVICNHLLLQYGLPTIKIISLNKQILQKFPSCIHLATLSMLGFHQMNFRHLRPRCWGCWSWPELLRSQAGKMGPKVGLDIFALTLTSSTFRPKSSSSHCSCLVGCSCCINWHHPWNHHGKSWQQKKTTASKVSFLCRLRSLALVIFHRGNSQLHDMTTPLAAPSPPISPNSWKVVAGVQADDLPVPVWESWQSGIEKRDSHPEHLHERHDFDFDPLCHQFCDRNIIVCHLFLSGTAAE